MSNCARPPLHAAGKVSPELTCERRVPEELLDVVVSGDAFVGQRDAAGEAPTGGVQ